MSGGNFVIPRQSEHQSCLDNKGPFTTGTTNVTIHRHDDVSLPPQERFQILSALGQDIKINKKFSKASYMSLRDDFFKMAADLDECGKEEAFILYHKFLIVEAGQQHPWVQHPTRYPSTCTPNSEHPQCLLSLPNELLDYIWKKINIGPKLRKRDAGGRRSNFIKILNIVFDRAKILKRKLLNKYNREYEKYLMEMKNKEEEATEQATSWEVVKSRYSTSCTILFDPLYGPKESKSGEVGPGITSTVKEAQPSSVPTKTSSSIQQCSVEENTKFVIPSTSTSAKQPGANDPEKSTDPLYGPEENKSEEEGLGATLRAKEAQPSSVPTKSSSPPQQHSREENAKLITPSMSLSEGLPGENATEESTVQKVRGLCPVILPHDLCEKFLKSARKNTKKKIETCGVLCGSMVGEEYHITHIVIPLQEGGPDYCYATNEEELFFIQEELGLLTLGWIHTHPTQRAFLSSVDLHTHFCYQQMLPESIAVVCAPKTKSETGIFSLTSTGINEISCCSMRGFHPHREDTPLFSICIFDCSHVTTQDTKVMITDLR
ncbi:STAM-binding protein-like [Psammomys obesus]|uniref:STAM-binding protein-like n=1 Tax=Psammomys obesus TaxID=48139 RepID=UPI002452ED5F|nr:STAM-binding protein-like [Psammomys obesus]